MMKINGNQVFDCVDDDPDCLKGEGYFGTYQSDSDIMLSKAGAAGEDPNEEQINVQEIADSITSLAPLGYGQNRITFPEVPKGIDIRIVETSDETVIDKNGVVYGKDKETQVTLTFAVTNMETQEEAMTVPLELTVPARQDISAEKMENFLNMKYGLFVHYVPALTVNADGSKIISGEGTYEENLEEFAAAFDVDQFVQDVKDMNVQYVIFTAWHAQMIALYPSRAMKEFGLENHQVSGRDLIGEIIDGLREAGVDVFLYTHPRDGHDMSDADAASVGWIKGNGGDPDFDRFDYDKWNDFVNAVYAELIDRYGDRISGLFVDEGSSAADSYRVVDYSRLRETIKSRNPDLMLMHNFYGTTYGLDLGMKEFFYWCEFASADGNQWPAFEIPTAVGISNKGWWAGASKGEDVCQYNAEDMFRYTVLQSSSNTKGGGTAWAAGPYPNGEGWEKNIKENMVRVGELLEPVKEAVMGTRPSGAYPTKSGTTVGMSDFVANTSQDGAKEYIHILNAPEAGNSIVLGVPEDGSIFASEAEALNDGEKFRVVTDPATKEVTLEFAENKDWSQLSHDERLDYVVELTVTEKESQETVYEFIDNTDTSVRYTGGNWSYQRWFRNSNYSQGWETTVGGDYEADIHNSASAGAYFEVPFEGTGVSYMPCTSAGNTDQCDIYIDGKPVAEKISLRTDQYIPQNEVFSIENLENGNHILKVVNTGSGQLVNDVVRVTKLAEKSEEPEEPEDPEEPDDPENPEDLQKPENPQEPQNSEHPSAGKADADQVKNVQTGDQANPIVWVIPLAVAVIGIAVVIIRKRRHWKK